MGPAPRRRLGFADRQKKLEQLERNLSGPSQSFSTMQGASEIAVGRSGEAFLKNQVTLQHLPQRLASATPLPAPRQPASTSQLQSKTSAPCKPNGMLTPSQDKREDTRDREGACRNENSPSVEGVDNLGCDETGSRTSALLQEFMDILPDIVPRVIEATIRVARLNDPCSCGSGIRTVTCFDCVGYPLRCESCFIERHVENPLHWAKVWHADSGTFVKRDISTLSIHKSKSHAVPAVALGHGGRACPNRQPGDPGIAMTLADVNGVHETRVILCNCRGHTERERMNQLLQACFFPATISAPRTAYTFRLLKQFHLLHLGAKICVQDFCKTLFRITDNAFHIKTDLKNFQEAFSNALQIWRLVTATKRLGQAHNIDDILVHRVKGNLIVHCPGCLEPHVNMEEGWRDTPEHLCHLNQSRSTLDGNHHANHYEKNGDPNSVSLFRGWAYFPYDPEYHKYLKSAPNPTDKTVCYYSNVINKQDRKKFKNMDITGIINFQCGHVFVKASTDMQLGERFANTDYAVHHANIQHKDLDAPEDQQYVTWVDHLCSYDIGCGWGKKREDRFEQLPESKPAVKSFRVLIPLLHVQNHKDNCMYRHACSYTSNAGHFHGETAEQYWAESNPLGFQVRQMNKGKRQDIIIDHHSFWNWMKTQIISEDTANRYLDALALYMQHRDHFGHLCKINGPARVEVWACDDRESRTVIRGKVHCVYRMNDKNAPTQKQIFSNLIKTLDGELGTASDDEGEGDVSDDPETGFESDPSDSDWESESELDSSSQPKCHRPHQPITVKETEQTEESIPVHFINEGLEVMAIQCKLKRLVHGLGTRPDKESLQKKVNQQRSNLRTRINYLRKLQKRAYTNLAIGDLTRDKPSNYDTPEQELLYLPSDFSLSDRRKGKLGPMADYELQLRQGFAYDCIRKLREISKVLSVNRDDKRDARGQKGNTQAQAVIDSVLDSLLLSIDEYNGNRAAMIKLGVDPTLFPVMRREDTYRKPTAMKRQVGDSRRVDGALFHRVQGARSPRKRISESVKAQLLGTNPKSPKAKRSRATSTQHTVADEDTTQDGWIWNPIVLGERSTKEMAKWSEESNHVQWFRAEAEMLRWREECETAIADLLRCIRYFDKMSDVWEELARRSKTMSAHSIYARAQARMFKTMGANARKHFTDSTKTDADALITNGELLAVHIQRLRDKEALEFAEQFPGFQVPWAR